MIGLQAGARFRLFTTRRDQGQIRRKLREIERRMGGGGGGKEGGEKWKDGKEGEKESKDGGLLVLGMIHLHTGEMCNSYTKRENTDK